MLLHAVNTQQHLLKAAVLLICESDCQQRIVKEEERHMTLNSLIQSGIEFG